jgi:hypothetical protein
MIISGLFSYLATGSPKHRSHYYRNRHLLEKRLLEIEFLPGWVDEDEALARELSKFGPLLPEDFSDLRSQNRLKDWSSRFPEDPAFYKMLVSQHQIYKDFASTRLKDFLQTTTAKNWMKQREKLSRPLLFEWDSFYKSSKKESLRHKKKVRALLRRYPLLGFKDLKSVGVKNAQPLMESFPHLKWHRQIFLENLKRNLSDDKRFQTKGLLKTATLGHLRRI